jgi:glycosyltransferase involved in cell wall biosynthesis
MSSIFNVYGRNGGNEMGGPLRILQVVVNMNRGGAETLIMNLYRNIDRSNVQFDFLTCKEGVFDSEIKGLGGRIFRIPYVTEIGHFQFIKELKRFFLINNHYQIVHCHLDKMSGLVLREADIAGIPIRISHSHNTRSEGGTAARMYKWYVGKFINYHSTHFISCSNEAAKWLFKENSNKSIQLKNGIEIEKFVFSSEIRKQVRDKLNLDDAKYVIGHVGRFNNQKNHSFLLDVFSKVSKEMDDAVLILVGDGELRSEIERKLKKLNLEGKVHLLGIRSDIPTLLQAFDLFVFPSMHEGLPVALIEAQGAGLPCIISNRISKGVDLGINLIDYVSISSKDNWVKKILMLRSFHHERNDKLELITKKGFNIRKTATELENYYFSISR